jgi:cell division protein FtsL
MWSFLDVLLLVTISVVTSALVSIVHNWSTARKLYSLQCDVADLQDKVLVEIKKRASLTFREKNKDDTMLEKIVEQAKSAAPAAPQMPWWAIIPRSEP